MRIILRLNEQRDQDIIYWLNHQENRSEAIREAIRKQIEMDKNVKTMLDDIVKLSEDPLWNAKADISFYMAIGCSGLEDVKKHLGEMYKGDREQLLDIAWNELYGAEKVKLSSIYGEEHENESNS